jgi:peptide/nickel transport system permease protein
VVVPPAPPAEGEAAETGTRASSAIWRGLSKNPTAMAGLVIVVFFALVAILAPRLAMYNPTVAHLSIRLLPPSRAHPFGTDGVGLDVFSRVIYGARIDMTSALMVVAVAGTVGTAVGMAAGWYSGWWDEILMRITDIFLAFPGLILAMAISAVLKPDLTNALLAISVTWWPIYARLGRGQALALRSLEYVEAARSEGASTAKIVFKHMLPNAIGPLLVQATLDLGSVILVAAGLSFIGFGAQPPTPEWGVMVSNGQTYLMTQWWVATFPALAILVLVIGFNLVGDALRDLLDPRLRSQLLRHGR